MLDRLTKTMFVENLHTIFRLQVEPTKTLDLELMEVREGRAPPQQEQFALLFRGPLESPCGQGIWPIDHARLGQFALFLVPVGRDPQGMQYEAVFNRFRPPES
jgi:hypothetical protein